MDFYVAAGWSPKSGKVIEEFEECVGFGDLSAVGVRNQIPVCSTHVPLKQTVAIAEHTLPHRLQFERSVRRSAHTEPHCDTPVGQLPTHDPLKHHADSLLVRFPLRVPSVSR